MRVLFITRKFPPSVGGMETYSKALFNALREISGDVDIYKPRRPMIGRPSITQMVLFTTGAIFTLLKNRGQYEAVLLGDFALSSLSLFAKMINFGKIRVVISVHGNDVFFLNQKTLTAAIYRWITNIALKNNTINAAIANSTTIMNVTKSIGIDEVHIIKLATSVPTKRHASKRRRAILFAGRLIKYKGLSWFVREVWPHVDASMELLVAGTVWDEDEYDCIQDQENIKYLGVLAQDQLFARRAEVMACIMPNRPPEPHEQDEGFGLSALEAPAVGTPIIAAKCGGLADAVVDGVTGFLLPPLDSGAWVRCLDDISRWSPSERLEFSQRARAYVTRHFSWQRVAKETLQVLAGVNPGHSPDNSAGNGTRPPQACRAGGTE